jgi:Flp pilus assembly protein TadG
VREIRRTKIGESVMNAVKVSGFTRRWRRARNALRLFGREEKAATAVEFGLIALPFIALLLAIIETAVLFLAGQNLESAVDSNARLIRTGQAQESKLNGTTFIARVCAEAIVLPNCTNNLHVDVRTYTSFDTMSTGEPIDAKGNADYSTFIFDAGHGGSLVLVRAYYEWPTFSRLLGLNFSNLSNGKHLLAAVAAFKNEPFAW